MAKANKKPASKGKATTVPHFGPEFQQKTKRASGKSSTKGEEEFYKNPVQEIVIKPDWVGSAEPDVRDFAIQLLEGYIWACKYQPNFMAVHDERQECEHILYRLSYLKKMDDDGKWVPDEDSMLQLALIDFVRMLPKMWD